MARARGHPPAVSALVEIFSFNLGGNGGGKEKYIIPTSPSLLRNIFTKVFYRFDKLFNGNAAFTPILEQSAGQLRLLY